MNRKTVFISGVQSEFATERKLFADYIRQDALFSMYFEPFLLSIDSGYVSSLYPDAYKRRDQAYHLTEIGLKLLSKLLKK